jgi:tetratricopeptide (TPR) repeat protein
LEVIAVEADAYELFRKGIELLAGHHPHQAATVLERARAAAPRQGSVSEALGRAYYEAGRPADAQVQFARVLELDPTNDYAHFGLALCLSRAGERTLAVGHLRLALAMRPGVAAYEEALARIERAAPGGGLPARPGDDHGRG